MFAQFLTTLPRVGFCMANRIVRPLVKILFKMLEVFLSLAFLAIVLSGSFQIASWIRDYQNSKLKFDFSEVQQTMGQEK